MVAKFGIDVKDIDLLICSTATPDMPVASTAAFIAAEIGANDNVLTDIRALFDVKH